MLVFLITCSLSLLLFSLSLNPMSLWASEMRLLSLWFWKDLSFYPITKSVGNTILGVDFSFLSPRKSPRNENSIAAENVGVSSEMSLLDLPDLVLECILEKLPPEGLCRMASVCTSLKDRCLCDHLWEKHMNRKWGRIVGSYAYREWQSYVATRKGSLLFNHGKQRGLMDNIIHLWHFMFIKPSFSKQRDLTPVDSIMSWYLALESGNFWFPAQVYNRENGHVGFVLSCYDARLSYDVRTDTFLARYPSHGTRHCAVESGVTWDRIRAPPVDTFPHNLHISDCLHYLQPGDQMEIQWRRNKEFPYGWWYGIVGHLETCDGDANYCSCRDSDTVVLEFKQYTRGSRWRRTIVNRKDHREEGNEVYGFYGGIRKLRGEEEISSWNKLLPAQVLE